VRVRAVCRVVEGPLCAALAEKGTVPLCAVLAERMHAAAL
jgi:hypothetical protein